MAYINGKEILFSPKVNVGGGEIKLQSKTVTPKATEQIVTPDETYNGLERVTVEGDANLVAENIAEGVAIFGVTGTHSGGSTGGGDIDALIEGTVTEVSSGATVIRDAFFKNITSLTSANFPNATGVGTEVFYGCTALANINFPKVTSIGNSAFRTCQALTFVSFPNATSIGTYAFNGCYFTSVDFPNATSIGKSGFSGCIKMKSVIFPKVTSIGESAFNSCTLLEIADFPKATSIGRNGLSYCYSLKAVILRSETICTSTSSDVLESNHHFVGAESNYNPTGAKDGFVYVPRALLSDDDATKDYRRATNWTTYADRFRVLEDYTVDGTITGALDESKI